MTLPLSAGSVEAAFTKPPFDENSVYGLMCAISRQKLNYSSHVPQGRNFRDARPAVEEQSFGRGVLSNYLLENCQRFGFQACQLLPM